MISKEQAGQMAAQKLFERLASAAKKANARGAYFHAQPQNGILNIRLVVGPPQETVAQYPDFKAMIKDSVSGMEWLALKMPKGQQAMSYIQSALIDKIQDADADFAICRPIGKGQVGFFAGWYNSKEQLPINMADFI